MVVIGADWNTHCHPIAGHVGRGVMRTSHVRDVDLETFLQEHDLVFLNSWGSARARACHTYVHGDTKSQIDFVALRRPTADALSRRAKPEIFDLAPWRRGAKHHAVVASVPWRAGWTFLNAAIAHVLSTHTWTTLSVNLDNMTVPHYDRGNAPGGSLLLGLTHHSAGGLWICDGSGSQLLEAEGVLSRGTTYCTQASAVLFEGRDCLHSTLPWSGNRCVIIAYTIGQYKSMEKEHQTYLETAGFRLPDLLAPDVRPAAPAGQPSASSAVQQRLHFGPAA